MHRQVTLVIIACLILFSIYRRVRRNIGWQELQPRKLQVRIALFLVIGLLFFVEGAGQPISLISDAAGILFGGILAYFSAGITLFEERAGRRYYRPNTWIGGLVIAVFLGRFSYRFYEIYQLMKSGALAGAKTDGLQNIGYTIGNSWTAGLMLIMFSYYAVYYLFLVHKQKNLANQEEISN